jgi:hypothetical protein
MRDHQASDQSSGDIINPINCVVYLGYILLGTVIEVPLADLFIYHMVENDIFTRTVNTIEEGEGGFIEIFFVSLLLAVSDVLPYIDVYLVVVEIAFFIFVLFDGAYVADATVFEVFEVVIGDAVVLVE